MQRTHGVETAGTDSWRKASYNATNASCVEVAVSPQSVGVRNTKDRDGGTLRVNPAQWADFVARLKDSDAEFP